MHESLPTCFAQILSLVQKKPNPPPPLPPGCSSAPHPLHAATSRSRTLSLCIPTYNLFTLRLQMGTGASETEEGGVGELVVAVGFLDRYCFCLILKSPSPLIKPGHPAGSMQGKLTRSSYFSCCCCSFLFYLVWTNMVRIEPEGMRLTVYQKNTKRKTWLLLRIETGRRHKGAGCEESNRFTRSC